MPTIVVIRNPFQPNDREIFNVEAGQTLREALVERHGDAFFSTDYHLSVNGQIDERKPSEILLGRFDYVALVPVVGKGGGSAKNIIGIVAMVALMMGGFGGAGAAGLGGLFGGGGMSSMLLLGGVMMLAGGLGKKPKVDIPNMPDTASSFEASPDWDNATPVTHQGNPIPITFGTVRMQAPQVVSQHVSVNGKAQELDLLLCGGEGPIDSVTNVEINGQAYNSFDDIHQSTKTSTFIEHMDPGGAYCTAHAALEASERVMFGFQFANGLYLKLPGGQMAVATVIIAVEYREAGTSGAWTAIAESPITFTECVTKNTTLYVPGNKWAAPDPTKVYEFRAKVNSFTTATLNYCYFASITSIGDYGNVTATTRLGTNDQAVVPGFDDTYADEAVGIEFDDDPVEHRLSGTANEGLEVSLLFPQGLAYYNDQGEASLTSVTLTSEYRIVGAGSWTAWGTWKIEEKEHSNFRKSFRLDNLTAGEYEIKIQVTARTGTTARYSNTVTWATATGIIYDDFERPGRVLVGLRAVATDKLQGSMPRITWTQTRANVLVWDTGTSAYVAKPATNPAWICYDMIHRARLLHDINDDADVYVVHGDAHTKIDLVAFTAWAAFCDETVGGDPRCSLNILLDSAGDLWTQIQKVAAMGRAAVVMRGTTWSAVWDGASTPVQMFGVGNVIIDSLSGEYTGDGERANALECQFINEDKDYQRDSVTVYGDDYDTATTISQPVSVTMTGITDYKRVWREGAYRLRLNKYLRRVISFKADVDAVACQVGDVILVSHDIPRWGTSGRIVSASTATATTITLDKPVTLTAGSPAEVIVRYSTNDTIATRGVVLPASGTATTSTVTLATSLATAPAQFDLFAFGLVDVAAKPFRVLRMGRDGDMRCQIDALEYYSEVYDETATVPTITYSTALPTVSAVNIVLNWDASAKAYLDISWIPPRDGYGGATVLVNGQMVERVGATKCSVRYPVSEDATYTATVIGLSTAGAQLAKVDKSFVVDVMTIPVVSGITPVEDTFITPEGAVITDIDVTYTAPTWEAPSTTRRLVYPTFQTISHVNTYYEADGSGTWIKIGTNSTGAFRVNAIKATTSVKIKIECVDKWGRIGAPVTSASLVLTGKSALPADVTGFTGTQEKYGIRLAWSETADPDIAVYEVRLGASWAAGAVVLKAKTTRYAVDFTGAGTFVYWIKALDTSGGYSANAATASVVIAAPATPIVVATAINGGIKLDIVHAQNPDFSHYAIQRKPTGGAVVDINTDFRSQVFLDTDIATLGYTTTWEYRVAAVDRNGATGSWSAGTTATAAKRIENLDITTDQIIAKDLRSSCNVGPTCCVAGTIVDSAGVHGYDAAGVRKTFIDSTTGIITAAGANISGTICAACGYIAGWSIGATTLSNCNATLDSAGKLCLGTTNDVVMLDAKDATYRLWAGNATAASAPFSVSKAGALKATSGCIAGWTLGASCLCNCNVVISSCGYISLGSGVGTDYMKLDAKDADYRLWIGCTTNSCAPFRVCKDGAMIATSATICGAVTATCGAIGGWNVSASTLVGGSMTLCNTGLVHGCYTAGVCGWQIDATGNAEFNSATIRGAMRSTVFQYQEVAAVGGQLLVANAGIVKTGVTTPAGAGTCFTLDVVDPEVGHAAQFASGDILRIQTWNGTALVAAWGTVTASSDQTTFFRYTVRLEAGLSQAIPARAAVVSYGTAAAGGGVHLAGTGTCSPFIDAFTTGAAPWSGYTVQTRLGRLDGIAGASGYGLWTNNGNIYGGVIQSPTFDATTGSCFGLAAGLLQLGGTGGGVSKCGIKWDGSCLQIYGNIMGGCIYASSCISTNYIFAQSQCLTCAAIISQNCVVNGRNFCAQNATFTNGCKAGNFYFGAADSNGCSVDYACMGGRIVDSTAGGHVGSFQIAVATCPSGTLDNRVIITQTDLTHCGNLVNYGCAVVCCSVGTPILLAGTCACSPIILGSTCVCSPLLVPGRIVQDTYCQTNSHAKFGSIEIQSYGLNNGWIFDNVYYSATGYKHRATGYGTAVYMDTSGDFAIYTAPSAAAGCAANLSTKFRVSNAGLITIPGTLLSCGSVCLPGIPTGAGTALVICNGIVCISSSSARFKCCIAPACIPDAAFRLLIPHDYAYCKGDGSMRLGPIAEQVNQVAPYLVNCEGGIPFSVDAQGLATFALAAAQRGFDRQDELDRRLADLEKCVACIHYH